MSRLDQLTHPRKEDTSVMSRPILTLHTQKENPWKDRILNRQGYNLTNQKYHRCSLLTLVSDKGGQIADWIIGLRNWWLTARGIIRFACTDRKPTC